MLRFFSGMVLFVLVLLSCDSQKKVVNQQTQDDQPEIVNTSNEMAIAGAVNFQDEESLSIYSAILKNVVGDKPGAYIGHQMDKLAADLKANLSYTELLRAGEGLILEFNNTSPLYFDSGKTSLNTSSQNIINTIIDVLKKYPKVSVIVETHTDSSGEESVNMTMTSERMESIKKYLLDMGIDRNRLKTKAFGESQPRYQNNTEENRKRNRRIEFGFYASDALKNEAEAMTQ